MESKCRLHTTTLFLLFLILILPVFSSAASAATGSPVNLSVHFIDVGQGDSILLGSGGKYMLIDAGERDKGDDVIKYLKSEGISSLDYVVATHAHSDHIGGMSEVLDTFPVGQFLDSGYPHTSATYEHMLEKIDSKNIPFRTVKRGDKIDFAPGIDIEVLNPGSSYFKDDLNQNSVVLKVTDGSVSFLLMGDAGVEAEDAIMQEGYNVDADILKVGHHASSTASGAAFISAVSPSVSVIEVGAGNDYGHPHQEILQRLQKVSTVYRTDRDGTVTVTTDGSAYSISTENAAQAPEAVRTPEKSDVKTAGSDLPKIDNLENKKETVAADVKQPLGQQEKNTPGFEVIYAIIGLLAVFLYRGK